MSIDTAAVQHGETGTAIDPATLMTSAVYAPVLCMVDYGIAEPEHSWVTGYQGVQLGVVDVFRYEGIGRHHGERGLEHVQADRMDDYLLTLPLRAHINIRQGGQTRSVEPGEFALLSTSQPFYADISSQSPRETFSAVHVRVSGSALRQRMPHAEECCWQAMRLRAGAGVILQQLCNLAVDQGRGLSPAEGRRFAGMLMDAVTNAALEAPELQSLPILSSNWAYVRIARQAKAYIENHLSDPGLDTDTVAAHCRVSKRYLQAVFADSGETVSSTVREMRLQRCREALRSPALRHQSVSQIAMHWGFADMPYFCRAYRARFDQTPSKDRIGSLALS